MPKRHALSSPAAIFAAVIVIALIAASVLATVLMREDDADGTSAFVDATATPNALEPVTHTDAFAYCDAVGTIDRPDARYIGPTDAPRVAAALEAAAELPAGLLTSPGAPPPIWRCVAGSVRGCFVGANLPCGKVDTSRTLTAAMNEACRRKGTLAAVDTGHATVYAWACVDGIATARDQIIEVDEQGFAAPYWYALSP